jgi:hypothetical protein
MHFHTFAVDLANYRLTFGKDYEHMPPSGPIGG